MINSAATSTPELQAYTQLSTLLPPSPTHKRPHTLAIVGTAERFPQWLTDILPLSAYGADSQYNIGAVRGFGDNGQPATIGHIASVWFTRYGVDRSGEKFAHGTIKYAWEAGKNSMHVIRSTDSGVHKVASQGTSAVTAYGKYAQVLDRLRGGTRVGERELKMLGSLLIGPKTPITWAEAALYT
jgi:hypothetical protein